MVTDYGVVLDCGSSGTRVFVYFWPRRAHGNGGEEGTGHELLDIKPLLDGGGEPVQLKVEPGLSSFGKNSSIFDRTDFRRNFLQEEILEKFCWA